MFPLALGISGSKSYPYEPVCQFLNAYRSTTILEDTSFVIYGHSYAPSRIASSQIDFIAANESGIATNYNTIEGSGPVRKHLVPRLSSVTQIASVRIYQRIT